MKIIAFITFLLLSLHAKDSDKIIRVGTVPVPHAQILEVIEPILEKEGYELVISEIDDKILNYALEDGQIDANFYQHEPYLLEFNKQEKTHLVKTIATHLEPMAIYSKKVKNISELPDGAVISIPNDPVNESRALLLLQEAGVIKLDDKNVLKTDFDIISNPKNITIKTMQAAILPRSIDDVSASIISTSYAMAAGLNPKKDGIFIENKNSPYVNIIAVKDGTQDSAKIKALDKALLSDEVRNFIIKQYNGTVIPAF
ncbi:MetQ/NlpA family ABC transporter substrate-binding protein [Campylobacter geochelonis]|uniref:D-methionine-binding lipoprotein MetQ n=1 Tax=Campylobacter geochelonis TaxID=1780362 RepID=A0A128EGY7_9BACT|nr:MetQ/NlpA family ABC transporter substrate-binding protein [Campylobacter geochelonis]QKF71381.1 DL-methionine ABC transporter MetINQ, substrate-binding protein [Campylobacter geochelonis]CZE48150.1 D-methionine-binding lipoprotein MetQ [Campylobacter geochelonis]CZE49143.1 D-methionine-binding lipoprotein MetQ [Campylobacter geochelonis]CZE51470.1 D-methionine-binding lipoprotein MetQ [Campylobacter geochelonis]